MLNLSEIANNLTEKEQGVWFSGNTATCSYPEDSSNRYFSIENDSFWFRHRNDAIISVVKMFSPGGFILDVGGANGYVTFRLKNSGFEAILLEPNIKGLQNAKKRGLSPVICSTATDAGFKDQVIPAIGLFDVLEHIEDDRGFLKELKRILSPNGRLYLTVPAYQTLWSSEDEYTGHFRRYTASRIKETLKSSGYTTVYTTYLFSYLPIALFFARTLPTKLGLGKPSTDKNAREENTVNSRITTSILSLFHKLELSIIDKKKTIPFGASLLLVANSEPGLSKD